MATPVKIGFIGAGKMATALARGIVAQGQLLKSGPQDLWASCPPNDAAFLEPFKALGCMTTHENKELVANSDVIILAVKPLVIPRVLHDVKSIVDKTKVIVSIAAGIKIGLIEEGLEHDAKVVRVMPNTPSLVQEGATVYSLGKNCSIKHDGPLIETIFKAVGPACHLVEENWIDAVTGISGSGPAYMYMIIGIIIGSTV
jgi:pyrroline-5-carboxylate reductase